MARLTVEDCIMQITDRFELVLLASQRVRQISAGSPLRVLRDNDKDTVVALREIAEKLLSPGHIRQDYLESLHRLSTTGATETLGVSFSVQHDGQYTRDEHDPSDVMNTPDDETVILKRLEDSLLRKI